MNPLDIELYKVFCKSFDQKAWWEEYIRNHPPTIENVFQKAKEKNLFYWIEWHYEKNKNFEFIEYVYFSNIDIWEHYIEYNPCLPILLQTDETKQELLNIFK